MSMAREYKTARTFLEEERSENKKLKESNEALLEACRDTLSTLEQAITKLQMNGDWASPEGIGRHHALSNLRQAIANAEGRQSHEEDRFYCALR